MIITSSTPVDDGFDPGGGFSGGGGRVDFSLSSFSVLVLVDQWCWVGFGGETVVMGGLRWWNGVMVGQNQEKTSQGCVHLQCHEVKTSASEFRALVQELTGQDADKPDHARFPEIGGGGGGSDDHHHHQEVPEGPGDEAVHEVPTMNPCGELAKKFDLSCEPYDDDDDAFMPQIIENFLEYFPLTCGVNLLMLMWSKA
ncbi:unnamed protein product [Ilex paraguariensis]|uniref:VQ domain-containing protein n=1 Tax=Ilex paraguariensis TaxID=185542 RepID=A0ABC8V565_9AQUA